MNIITKKSFILGKYEGFDLPRYQVNNKLEW